MDKYKRFALKAFAYTAVGTTMGLLPNYFGNSSSSTSQRAESDITEIVGVPRSVHYGPTHSGGYLSVVTGSQESSHIYSFRDSIYQRDFGKAAALIDAEIRDGDAEPITIRYNTSSKDLVGVSAYGQTLKFGE